jgi:ferritin-like metal-binding protein YciE
MQGDSQMMNSMMEKLFLDQLKDIYYVEKTQVKALGKMAKKATTEELRDILIEHQEVSQEQLSRLDQIFEILGKRAQAKRCPVMDGLQEEADEMMSETEDDTLTRDVALIITAQKVEHYEIASYGCLATLARTYGMQEVADLLQETLDEEKDADQQLTYIAENNINFEAGQEEGEEEEEE